MFSTTSSSAFNQLSIKPLGWICTLGPDGQTSNEGFISICNQSKMHTPVRSLNRLEMLENVSVNTPELAKRQVSTCGPWTDLKTG